MKNNPLVWLSILAIKKIWHGRIGRGFNDKKGIICRFHPSCSNYGIQALRKYGFIVGWWKTLDRIRRCRPSNTDSAVDYP